MDRQVLSRGNARHEIWDIGVVADTEAEATLTALALVEGGAEGVGVLAVEKRPFRDDRDIEFSVTVVAFWRTEQEVS